MPRPQTLAVLLIAAALAAATARRRVRHLVVAGSSMSPTLEPGDRLIALRTGRRPRPGQLAVTTDPRAADRALIKRVHAVHGEGVDLRGDHAAASTDTRTFGTVPVADVDACLVLRYHPPERAGRVSGSRARGRRPGCRPAGPR